LDLIQDQCPLWRLLFSKMRNMDTIIAIVFRKGVNSIRYRYVNPDDRLMKLWYF